MRSLLRLVLVWLVAIALPVQGMAAVAMLHCQDRDTPAAADAHAVHDHAAHGHAAADDATDGADDAAAIPGHTCSACAACCGAFAIPVGEPAVAGAPATRATAAPQGAAAPRFITGGPERPPRTSQV